MRITESQLRKIIRDLAEQATGDFGPRAQRTFLLKGEIVSADTGRFYSIQVSYKQMKGDRVSLDLEGTDPRIAADFSRKAGLGKFVLVGVVPSSSPDASPNSWSLREIQIISEDPRTLPRDI